MPSAMDRCRKTLVRRAWIASILALGAADLGCSKLKSSRRDDSPPPIGQLRDSNDIYAAVPPTADAGALGGSSDPARSTAARQVAAAARQPIALRSPESPAARLVSDRQDQPQASPAAGADAAVVVAEARQALDAMPTYEVALRRQERVNGNLGAEEDVTLAVRRQPLAIRLTWPTGPHKGREVIYRADEPGGLMHVNPGPPLPRINLAPDSPLVLRNSRHPITEAGFDSLVRTLEADLQHPDQGSLNATGDPVAGSTLVRVNPSGETWRVAIDPTNHLPTSVECTNSGGQLLERYAFRDVRANPPELSDTGAFDPDARWGPPRGIFGFGRAAKDDGPTPR